MYIFSKDEKVIKLTTNLAYTISTLKCINHVDCDQNGLNYTALTYTISDFEQVWLDITAFHSDILIQEYSFNMWNCHSYLTKAKLTFNLVYTSYQLIPSIYNTACRAMITVSLMIVHCTCSVLSSIKCFHIWQNIPSTY